MHTLEAALYERVSTNDKWAVFLIQFPLCLFVFPTHSDAEVGILVVNIHTIDRGSFFGGNTIPGTHVASLHVYTCGSWGNATTM